MKMKRLDVMLTSLQPNTLAARRSLKLTVLPACDRSLPGVTGTSDTFYLMFGVILLMIAEMNPAFLPTS